MPPVPACSMFVQVSNLGRGEGTKFKRQYLIVTDFCIIITPLILMLHNNATLGMGVGFMFMKGDDENMMTSIPDQH